jgi:uncharacterized membrane protein
MRTVLSTPCVTCAAVPRCDVSTQSAGMRQIVLLHALIAYLFNTAVIALGVNIAASLAS